MFQGSLVFLSGPTPVFGKVGTTAADEPVPEPLPPLPLLPPPEVAHVGPVMVLACSVNVPADSAKTRPFKVAPVFKAVVPFWAMIVPINDVVVSRVAELPIRHQTLQGSPPVTDEPGDVMMVDTVLKIQTPEPVRVRFPDNVKALVEQ